MGYSTAVAVVVATEKNMKLGRDKGVSAFIHAAAILIEELIISISYSFTIQMPFSWHAQPYLHLIMWLPNQ